jgi:hypothetical protein
LAHCLDRLLIGHADVWLQVEGLVDEGADQLLFGGWHAEKIGDDRCRDAGTEVLHEVEAVHLLLSLE